MQINQSLIDQIQRELANIEKGQNLSAFVREMKKQGIEKQEIYLAFDFLRSKHESDEDETQYDAILDTLDLMTGWCTPEHAIFGGDE